jgi:hypothetical protein
LHASHLTTKGASSLTGLLKASPRQKAGLLKATNLSEDGDLFRHGPQIEYFWKNLVFMNTRTSL